MPSNFSNNVLYTIQVTGRRPNDFPKGLDADAETIYGPIKGIRPNITAPGEIEFTLNLPNEPDNYFNTNALLSSANHVAVTEYDGPTQYFITGIETINLFTAKFKAKIDALGEMKRLPPILVENTLQTLPYKPNNINDFYRFNYNKPSNVDMSSTDLTSNLVNDDNNGPAGGAINGTVFFTFNQFKTKVPDLKNIDDAGKMFKLLEDMDFTVEAPENAFTSNNRSYQALMTYGDQPFTVQAPGAIAYTRSYDALVNLFELVRDNPNYNNLVQDMWWTPFSFGAWSGSKYPEWKDESKLTGWTQPGEAFDGFWQRTITLHVDSDLDSQMADYRFQYAGQTIEFTPLDFANGKEFDIVVEMQKGISSTDTNKITISATFSISADKPSIVLGSIKVPSIKLNVVNRPINNLLQTSGYSTIASNGTGLLIYSIAGIPLDKLDAFAGGLVSAFTKGMKALTFGGSFAGLVDANNTMASGGSFSGGFDNFANQHFLYNVIKPNDYTWLQANVNNTGSFIGAPLTGKYIATDINQVAKKEKFISGRLLTGDGVSIVPNLLSDLVSSGIYF